MDRDRRYVVDHLLYVLDELLSGLIVRLTLLYGTYVFVAPWRAHRCRLGLQNARFLLIASASVDRAGLDIDNFKVFNLVAFSFRVAI